ncbi:hypothetical protein E4L96_03225 [Massilia arenosa]|uniref:Uncharacterized protein n=1 Tax=Zemynaea arenosa TaxID=2561931 RepID=A0A4Y9SMQ4_9BURK|nr:hypothetical protein [Massilia arenosa]TFW27828.1 hypothetical protein E4L96_03225 [Massilia arenosa]
MRTHKQSDFARTDTDDFARAHIMFDVSHLLAWLLLTIVVPLIAPVALLALLALSRRFRHRARELLHRSIREGQLCWTAIALSAAATYEAADVLTRIALAGDTSGEIALGWGFVGCHVLIIVVASVIVLLGVMDAVLAEDAGDYTAGATPLLIRTSIGLVLFSAALSARSHMWAMAN